MAETKPAINSSTIVGVVISTIAGFIISQGWFPEDANAPINQVVTTFVEAVLAIGIAVTGYGIRKSKGDIKGIIK